MRQMTSLREHRWEAGVGNQHAELLRETSAEVSELISRCFLQLI